MSAQNPAPSGKLPTAQEIIKELKLEPHPEKGFFIETFRDPKTDANNRALSTQIYYLLEGEAGPSHWHRVSDAVEVWHYYGGAPLKLSLAWNDGTPVRDVILGAEVLKVSNSWQRRCQLAGDRKLIAAYPGSTTAGDCGERRVAACAELRRLDAGWLHCRASVRHGHFRDGEGGMGAKRNKGVN
jgi:hypothetical protein